MSLVKRYGKWLSTNNIRKYDLAELIAFVIFIPLVIIETKILHSFSIWINFLMLIVTLNFYQLGENIFRSVLGKNNVNVPKWIHAIPFVCFIFYIIIKDFN